MMAKYHLNWTEILMIVTVTYWTEILMMANHHLLDLNINDG